MARETTPFVEHMAKLYNESTPREQKRLDRKLVLVRAGAVATPQAMYHLFPTLGAKTLKLAKPAPQMQAGTGTPPPELLDGSSVD